MQESTNMPVPAITALFADVLKHDWRAVHIIHHTYEGPERPPPSPPVYEQPLMKMRYLNFWQPTKERDELGIDINHVIRPSQQTAWQLTRMDDIGRDRENIVLSLADVLIKMYD